jgi:hypothetical protein
VAQLKVNRITPDVVQDGKRQYYAARFEQRRTVLDLVDSVDQGVLNPLSTIEAIAFNGELKDSEKVQRIQDVLRDKKPQCNAAFEQMTAIKTQVGGVSGYV